MPPPKIRWALVAALAAVGCRGASTPEEAYRTFASALQRRDDDRAWDLLSAASRDHLDRMAREASAASGGAVPASGKVMIVAGDPHAKAIRSVTEVSRSGDSAVVAVDDGSGPREVRMVRESFRWRVRLDGS